MVKPLHRTIVVKRPVALQEAIRLIFSRFRELGSARQVLRKRSLTPTLHRKR